MWYNKYGDSMKILKKENWWIWLILFIFSETTSTLVLGALLDVYDKKVWYTKWKYWIIGLVLVLPIFIMMYAFIIEITTKTAAKLNVKGHEYYLSPYVWIILLIIPIIGWILFGILYLYINISILVKLYEGEGEKFIN